METVEKGKDPLSRGQKLSTGAVEEMLTNARVFNRRMENRYLRRTSSINSSTVRRNEVSVRIVS